MKPTVTFILSVFVLLTGCIDSVGSNPDGPVGATRLPDDVLTMAAPGQDLQDVRVFPEDGCYWYRYVGPVETTYLPLRTRDGRPICTRPQ